MSYSAGLRVALVTDVHYADADSKGTRHYRESLAKLNEAASVLRPRRPHLAVCLGDLIDSPPTPSADGELAHLKAIDGVFRKLSYRRVYVLGNHCVAGLSKGTYLRTVRQRKSYFSFDLRGWHFVVLDGCFRADGAAYCSGNFAWTDTEIPAPQRAWLQTDLARNALPTIVFCHQRLDCIQPRHHRVKSAQEIRRILASSGNVRAVFMGHSHQNALATLDGIPYATLEAMVEGSGPEKSGYSLLNLAPDGTLRLEGFRRHAEHPLAR